MINLRIRDRKIKELREKQIEFDGLRGTAPRTTADKSNKIKGTEME